MRKSFSLFDKDGDGTISTVELGTVLECMGHTVNEKQLHAMIEQLDADQSGTVDFNEFSQLMYEIMKAPELEEEIKEAFRVFDKDQNGFVSAIELRKVLNSMGDRLSEADSEDLIKEADQDGDGQLNFEEFRRVMKAGSANIRLN